MSVGGLSHLIQIRQVTGSHGFDRGSGADAFPGLCDEDQDHRHHDDEDYQSEAAASELHEANLGSDRDSGNRSGAAPNRVEKWSQ